MLFDGYSVFTVTVEQLFECVHIYDHLRVLCIYLYVYLCVYCHLFIYRVEESIDNDNSNIGQDTRPDARPEHTGVLGELQKLRKICNKVDLPGCTLTQAIGTIVVVVLMVWIGAVVVVEVHRN